MDTAKNWLFNKAPKHIKLFGDKDKLRESATHIIEFPGGSIELSRTSNNEYWAHIAVNHGWTDDDQNGFWNKNGKVVDGRIDTSGGIFDFADLDKIKHIAIRIK